MTERTAAAWAGAGAGVLAGSLTAAVWYAFFAGAGAIAPLALIASFQLALVAVIGKTSVRSAGAVIAGLAADLVAGFTVYFMSLSAQDVPVGVFFSAFLGALLLISGGATLVARRAAPAGGARDIVTMAAAAFFTAVFVGGAAITIFFATMET